MKFLSALKKNLSAFSATSIGILHFFLLALPFGGDFARSEGRKSVILVSGYQSMSSDIAYLDAGGFAVFAQTITLITAISLLLLGSYLLVRYFLPEAGNLPDRFGDFTFRKLCGYGLLGYAGCSLLVLLAVIILSAANVGSNVANNQLVRYGFSIGIGPIFGVLLSGGNIFALWFLTRKGLPAEPDPRFCSVCGAVLERNAAFCSRCGTKVETEPVYACCQCGAASKAGVAFCSQCGGRIIEK